MSKLNRLIPAAKFKAECLHLMNTVHEKHVTYIITKRGKPFAKLVPISKVQTTNYFGYLQGTATTEGNIIDSLDLQWDAEK